MEQQLLNLLDLPIDVIVQYIIPYSAMCKNDDDMQLKKLRGARKRKYEITKRYARPPCLIFQLRRASKDLRDALNIALRLALVPYPKHVLRGCHLRQPNFNNIESCGMYYDESCSCRACRIMASNLCTPLYAFRLFVTVMHTPQDRYMYNQYCATAMLMQSCELAVQSAEVSFDMQLRSFTGFVLPSQHQNMRMIRHRLHYVRSLDSIECAENSRLFSILVNSEAHIRLTAVQIICRR